VSANAHNWEISVDKCVRVNRPSSDWANQNLSVYFHIIMAICGGCLRPESKAALIKVWVRHSKLWADRLVGLALICYNWLCGG